jgi:hypothetical protein
MIKPKSIVFRYDDKGTQELVFYLDKSNLHKLPEPLRGEMSKMIDEALSFYNKVLEMGTRYQEKHPLRPEDITIEVKPANG